MKKWLTENKIYFELLSPILFGVAAVLVSYASYTVSNQQLRLSEISLKPHLHVETTYIFDQKKSKYVESELYVLNTGAPINNSKFSIKSFLTIEHNKDDGRVKTYLPIVGYYPAQFDLQTPSGKLVTFKGHLNNENFFRLHLEINDERTINTYGFVDINLEHIVIVDYRDRRGVANTDYFIDRILTEKNMVIEKLESHQKSVPIEIEGLTADELMEKVLEYEKQEMVQNP